jgi:hypothetical protein
MAYLLWTFTRLPEGVLSSWASSLGENGRAFRAGLLLILSLVPVNWLLESVKWKLLAGKVEPISLGRSFSGILYGVCLGFVTPRRTGEIAGRALVLQPGHRLRGMLVNTAGSLSQLGVTLAAGLASLAFLLLGGGQAPAGIPVPHAAVALPALLLALLALALLTFRRLLRWYLSRSSIPEWSRHADVLLGLRDRELLWQLLLSAARYLVFTLQFYLLLRLFQAALPFGTALLLLSVTYLLLTAIPLSALGEAGVRGPVVLLAAGMVPGLAAGPSLEAGMVAAILALWLVNLVLPAIAGALQALAGGIPLQTGRALS